MSSDAEKLREALRLLERVPGMLNRSFAAGAEERENGSAHRQGKLLDQTRAYEQEVLSFCAALAQGNKT